MGNYNADPVPDLSKITMIAHGMNFMPLSKVKADQFSTLGSQKVYTLVTKKGKNRLRILVDPSQVPGL